MKSVKSVRLLLVVAGLLAAACLSACSSSGQGGGSTTKDGLISIKLGWQKIPTVAPNYLMVEEGEKYGLDIELVEFNRYSDMRVALENGSIDFGTVGPGDVALSADSRKSQLVALAGQATGADLLAKRAGSGPLSWKDLASGSVRFGSFGAGIAWVKTLATLDQHGYDIGEVNEIKIAGTIQDVIQTLKSGGTDVVMNVDPAIAQGVEDGYAEYADELDINSSPLGAQNSLFVANRELLDKPDVISRVLKNYVAQIERLNTEPGLWASVYQRYSGIELPVAQESLKRIRLDLHFSQQELVAFADFLARKGIAQNAQLAATVGDQYDFGPLADVTGKSPEELGRSE
ncbi:ABC transporter substrate-binding protein [Nocardia sp. NBC_01329]|uniref:ABC transporter substrate-binding protein n=1 Tax=Nocardia sp. NBC_01329 TaxID=2903594 RepID=UPI002E0D6F7A|nr:PhnD/SsuA/transferrin family substrate-binding protein [Nocardia sp. NBC_01329]